MKLPVIVIGGGGHSLVLIDVLRLLSFEIIGYTDPDVQLQNKRTLGVKYLGDDDVIYNYAPKDICLVNAIGSVASTKLRCEIYQTFQAKGYSFSTVVHPSAIVSSDVLLSEGVQIMAGAIIQPGSQIGPNTLINTKASVDHACTIGAHVHIAPGVTLSGGVYIEDNAHVGTGATVIQQIHIGNNSVVGAGAVVLKNVRAKSTVYGIPAKEVEV
jgi:sugar O-acyltransferase (sialic acid O-acetyltransferase NeuD family)